MSRKAALYAAALTAALSEGERPKDAAERFVDLLRKRGDMHLAPQVIGELARREEEKTARVVTARPLSSSLRSEVASAVEAKGFEVKERVDPGVLGGVALFVGKGYLVDGTFSRKLGRLFA